MADVILDTIVLSEVLIQYFTEKAGVGDNLFKRRGALNEDMVLQINKIVNWHNSSFTAISYPGLIIASTFGFVEIARQFEKCSGKQYSVAQFAAFIEQPPEWFSTASLSSYIFSFLVHIPSHVDVNGELSPIEWADAIHVATALSRDGRSCIATTDHKLRAMQELYLRIL